MSYLKIILPSINVTDLQAVISEAFMSASAYFKHEGLSVEDEILRHVGFLKHAIYCASEALQDNSEVKECLDP